MTNDDPRTKELLRRFAECKTKMMERKIYLKPFALDHTDVQSTWRRHGWVPPSEGRSPPPAPEGGSTSSNLVKLSVRSAGGK